ncbi:hypothetical protein [Acidovorax sp.]|uniref:hypothetical protein n=1 Tax=Acidovorax sp. TaxID=1872122 RepID=UPI003D009AAA
MSQYSASVRALVVVCAFAAQGAMAHTTIQAQAAEATTTYNNVVIGHGCTVGGASVPVIAQSVVFPTVNPVVTVSGNVPASISENPLSIESFANIAQLIQNRNVFTKQAEKKNATGQVIGFEGTEGSLDPSLHGLIPFRTAGVTFKPNSCAKQLLVKVAIADICVKNGAANLWIPSLTPKYTNPNVDGIGSPATLTINRDLTKNPLPSSCGEGYTITLTPSPADVDANLPIPGYLN